MSKRPAIIRHNLADSEVVSKLKPRSHPYWNLLSYCRHLGIEKRSDARVYWLARVRTTAGLYKRERLGLAEEFGIKRLSYDEAVSLAEAWFGDPRIAPQASDPYPVGVQQYLRICPIGDVYTVGHAMHDYIEWKRIAAARTHFETNLSLINHHILPRLASVPLDEFSGKTLQKFALDVLETPPKMGNQQPGLRRPIGELTDDELRKRKKTLNTLISILRVGFQMAWENGLTDNERAWRCLRRVPHVDRPRTIFLDRGECRRLLSCCSKELSALVLGALYTGCRASELADMLVGDVAIEGYGVYISPSKNYRPRFVFLPDEGMAFFLSLCEGKDAREHVFFKKNGRPWNGSDHKHVFKEAVQKSGLPDALVFHGLRHTYASQLVRAGASLQVVAQQLGHASIETVIRTYGHIAPQYREVEIERRFEILDVGNADRADQQKRQLAQLRSSFKNGDWRDRTDPPDHTTWPRSNHSRMTGPVMAELKNHRSNHFE